MFDGLVEKLPIMFLVEKRQQGIDRRRDIANETSRNRSTAAKLLGPNVDLCYLGSAPREKLPVGKVRTQHEEKIATVHRVIAGRETDQASHADVVRIGPLDMLLAAKGMDHRCFQLGAERNELIMCSRTPRSAQQSDPASTIQKVGESLQVGGFWHHDRSRWHETDICR